MIRNWPGFAWPARILAAGLFAGAFVAGSVDAKGAASTVSWISDRADTNRWVVEVSGLSAGALKALAQTNWTSAQWQRLLAVHAEQGDLIADVGMPAMTGTYSVEGSAIRFAPQFPLEPGLKYRASFYPQALPGDRGEARFATVTFQMPPRATTSTTVVKQIYPSADVVPENLLKFYIHFSAPMSRGHIYDHIHLRNSAGKDVMLPFLEIDEELWNPDLTRLTLFIDPGRIKRGVTPLEEVGPALEQGKRFTLVIDKEWRDARGAPLKEAFQKAFEVGPVDREPINPAQWKIQSPRADTRGALTILFSKPLDHALAQRVITVADGTGQLLSGDCALEDQERRWDFTPKNAWRSGPHTLLVQKTIEDLAGNNIGKAFEVDLFESVQRRFTNETIKLPFDVR